MNMRDAALKYCGRIEGRLVFLDPDLAVSISEIKKGVLFVWAIWSVPAKQGLQAVATALSSSPTFGEILLYLADNDAGSTEQFMTSIGQTPSGMGETFWISNGEIVASLKGYSAKDLDVLVRHNRELLSAN